MNENETRIGFDRYLSSVDVWAIAFGCIVGWGAFVMPGTTFLPVAGPFGTLIAMVISVLIMLVIGTNFAFLMVKRPGTGGVYSYTKEAFGRDHAFICSWFLCLSYLTIVFLNGTALFVVVRTLFNDLLQSEHYYVIAGNEIYPGEVALSVVALVCVGLLFITAKKFLQNLHTVLSLIMLIGSVIITAGCLPHARFADMAGAFGLRDLNPAYVVFSIVLLAPWAFVGFDVVSMETAHFKFPIKRSGRIIRASILLAGFVYAAMCFVSICAVPEGFASWIEYIHNLGSLSGIESVPTFYAAASIMGKPGLVIMAMTSVSAILTGMIGAYRAATRVLSSMAEDHILSEKFLGTTYSILFIMIISVLIAFLGKNALNWFVDLTSFGAIVGFGYTSTASWKLAKMENDRKIIATSIAGTVITVAFGIVQLIPRLTALEAMGSASFLLLSLWCLLGFLFYWRTVNNSTLSEFSGISTSGSVLFSLLLYSVSMWMAKRLIMTDGAEEVFRVVTREGLIFLIIVFAGLIVMLYIQNLVREKHEVLERERIHAVESSLAKSRFLFNMSHDIRTPMNAILGYTNLALKEEQSPVIRDYLTKIDSSGARLLDLINDILEMSRIESGTLELDHTPNDITKILKETKDLFAAIMEEKKLTFRAYTEQVRHPFVWCDKKALDRILLNLIGNAYKFTPENGTVSAAVWEKGNGENGIGTYEIRVRDSGIGMSREFADRMFNAFERERTSTVSGIEGTGLGLSITKSLVDLMDGTIDVITSPGGGTEFIIRLKFRLAKEEDIEKYNSEKQDSDSGDTYDFSGKRVLLAEDNEINREIAEMILTNEGFIVESAENGKIAVDMLSASKPGYYDIILMDIQMPVMDGYEAAREIRALDDKELASIPIVAMTANAFKEDVDASLESGMQAHVAKPIDISSLMNTLGEILSEKH